MAKGEYSLHPLAIPITEALMAVEGQRRPSHHNPVVIIDSSSSADILFGEAYDQMQFGNVPLEAVDTSLYGFAGELVHPRGMILLSLTLGTAPLRKTCLLKFLVVDIPSAYNVILGRPTLNAFRAIISTYYMKIKFPVIGEVGEAQTDALQTHKCYVEAIKRGKKKRTEESPKTENSNKRGKDPIPSLEPGNPGKITKIGSKMTEDVRNQVVNCLRRNKDIFAWTPPGPGGDRPRCHHAPPQPGP
ncbi:UNVERIFIED_CONTAM: hypothetical protein Scaly_0660100 [Sesamum calycinum]|uniref:Uncharacterized protein n=1 Tax=Sesamum calycinum TaxID=2727403 RepID=A0AAW2RU97_9LAMI